MEDAEKELQAERQKLLGDRSAYEALMDELARGGLPRGSGSGRSAAGTAAAGRSAAGGGADRSRAELRALLQRLRTEQLGDASEDSDGEDDGGVSSDDGAAGGEEEDEDGLEDAAVSSEDNGEHGPSGKRGKLRQPAKATPANGVHNGSLAGQDEAADEDSDDEEEEEDDDEEEIEGMDGEAGAGAGAGARSRQRDAGREKVSDSEGEGTDEGGGTQTGSDEGSSADEGESEDGDEGAGADAGTAAGITNGGTRERHPPSSNGATAAVPDQWARHVGRELSEMEVAALGSGRSSYVDAPAADLHSAAWGPHSRWQVRVYGAAGSKAAAAAAAAAAARGGSGACGLSVGLGELPAAPAALQEYGVKERLISRWREVRQEDEATGAGPSGMPKPGTTAAAEAVGAAAPGDFATPQQRSLFALLNSYADVHLPCRPYPTDPGPSAADPLLDAVLLHCLNHVSKSADRIKKNNHALEQREQQRRRDPQEKEGDNGTGRTEGAEGALGGSGGTPRDQGFTRAKVLLLLPQRNLAFRAVRRLVALAIRETRSDSVQGKEKLVEQFTDPDDDGDDPDAMDAASRARWAARPAEHRALFSGNLDDHFRLGIKVTKGAIRLFADLYQSDIIVASPVALATKLAEDKRADPHAAPDFLSSVEVLVLDRADMMGMQNWAHVETVVAALNHLPREQHGTDIMRVRDWYLAGQAGLYRQTVLLSSYATPYTNALARAATNWEGAVRLAVEQPGVLGAVVPQVRQLFERFSCTESAAAASDARFDFFMRSVWPRVKDSVSRGLLLFIPSYFDFVRLRNALKAEDAIDFAAISEYSSSAEVTRARARFYHGQRRMLLYTERAHFYHRYRIRGIKDILFFGLPDHGHYYSELLNLLEEGGTLSGGAAAAGAKAAASHHHHDHHATVTALFCSWDVLQLERVVGSSRARKMLRGESGTYMFC